MNDDVTWHSMQRTQYRDSAGGRPQFVTVTSGSGWARAETAVPQDIYGSGHGYSSLSMSLVCILHQMNQPPEALRRDFDGQSAASAPNRFGPSVSPVISSRRGSTDGRVRALQCVCRVAPRRRGPVVFNAI